MQKIDLKTSPIPRLFLSYFIPSLFTMLALSTYSTVDGIFIGRKMGSEALAAIAIVWPVFPVVIAFELLFSLGGSTLAAIYLGKNKPKLARVVFSSVFYFVCFMAFVCSIFGYFFTEEIVRLLGASKELEVYAIEYLRVIAIGLIFIILHPLSDFFVVNDKRPMLATLSMLIGAISNIVLNYFFIFVFEWGIAGSAWATIMAHCIGFFIIFQHFLRKRGDLYLIASISYKSIISAMKIGVPQSIAEVSAAAVMFLFNSFLMYVSGERGVAIYGILMYSGIAYFSILFSVSQGMQPIVAYSFGARLYERIKKVYVFAFFIVLAISLVLYFMFYFFSENLVDLFLRPEKIVDEFFVSDVVNAIRIYYIGFVFLGINMLSAIFLQSIRKTWQSLVVTLAYTIGILGICIPILSYFYGQNGVWISYPLSQFLAFVIACVVLYFENKKIVRERYEK